MKYRILEERGDVPFFFPQYKSWLGWKFFTYWFHVEIAEAFLTFEEARAYIDAIKNPAMPAPPVQVIHAYP